MKKYLIGAAIGAVGYHLCNKFHVVDKVKNYVTLGKMWATAKLSELKKSTEEATGE